MQWPNGRTEAAGFNPYTITGASGFDLYSGNSGADKAIITCETWSLTASKPDGYAPVGAYSFPIDAGAMTAGQPNFGLVGAGNAIQGSLLGGVGNIVFAGSGSMSLIVSITGNGNISITGDGGLSLTIGLSGAGNISITGAGGLSMLVPFAGAGAFGLTGAGDMRGRMTMEGSWGGATPLSPEGLANAVWGALATANNNAGTMGAKVNASGSASDPWSVVLEGTYTAADLMRVLSAALGGKVSGAGTATETFRSIDDSRNAIVATVDQSGNRTAITVNR